MSNTSNRRVRALLAACAFAVLAAVCCLLASPSTARADSREIMAYSLDASGNHVNYYTTDDAIHAGYEGKVVYLACDWMFTGTMKIADSKTITIDMNGHKITSQGNGSVIRMEEHAKLTLQCSNASAARAFTYTGYDGNGNLAERTLTIGGLIVAGSASSDGNAVHMEKDCTLTLDNVAIAGNTNKDAHAAVYALANCTVNINNGATIRNNYGYSGGIRFGGEDCYLNMNNGSIADNYGHVYAGGVYGEKDALRITMENGSTISGNTGGDGGGVCFGGSWYYIVSSDGTGSIKNNKAVCERYERTEAYGGGICVYSKSSTSDECKIEGLTISGNYSNSLGGGLYLNQNNTRVINCTITNNTCDDKGGGIYLGGKYCSFEGSTAKGNTAGVAGGGVYVVKNVKLAGSCTVKDNKSGKNASDADDMFINSGANFYGQAGMGSEIGLRISPAEKRLIGWDLNYANDSYFSDFDDYYIYKGAGGTEAWMFPLCKSPKLTLTVERPTVGKELPETARLTWSDESWEYIDCYLEWFDETGNKVTGKAEAGKSYRACMSEHPSSSSGLVLPSTLSADDVTVRYADDTTAGPFKPQDAHLSSGGNYLNITTELIDAISANPEHGDGDDVLPDGGSGETDGGAGASDGASADGSGTPKTADASAPAATVAVVGGVAALLAAVLRRRED